MQIGKEPGARIQKPGEAACWAYGRVGVPADPSGLSGKGTVGAFVTLFLKIGACRLDRMSKR